MRLNEQVNAQISVLTERVKKLTTTIRRMDYMLCASGVMALAAFFFPNTLSLDISSLDIPSTLLDSESATSGQYTSALSSLIDFISTVGPFAGLAAIATGVYLMMSHGSFSSGLQVVISGIILNISPYIAQGLISEEKYINNTVMRSIIDFDESEPISKDLIGKVSRVDERYVLAQAAILSKADYPKSYFKSLAVDLSKESFFIPTDNAMYSIEMAAYGHPKSGSIVDLVETRSGYEKIASMFSLVGLILSAMLFLGGAALKLLRMSIKKRLKTILQLVTASRDNGEVV